MQSWWATIAAGGRGEAGRGSIGMGLALLLALLLAACSGVARAQTAQTQPPRTSSLSWVRLPGAEQCISTRHLASAVERRIGRRAFVSASQADISLEGRVERLEGGAGTPARWRATLIVSDPQGAILGERVLHADGEDCSLLKPSLTLVVAIAIDPGAALPTARGPNDELSGEARAMLDQLELPEGDDRVLLEQLAVPDGRRRPRGPPEPAPTSTSTGGQRAPDDASGRPGELRIGLGGMVELGSMPGTAPGATLWVAYLPRPWVSLELAFEGLFPTERQAQPEGRAEVALTRGALGACARAAGDATLAIRLCVGAAAGVSSVDTSGFVDNFQHTRAWAEARAGLRLELTLGRLVLELGARGVAPLIRDRLRYVDDAGVRRTLHRPDALTSALYLAAGMRFR